MKTDKSIQGPGERAELTRRDFLTKVGIGGGVLLFGQFGVNAAAWALSDDPVLRMVLVDYTKCTGCRTCEAACSSRNRPATVAGREVPGLGNPRFANIRVHSFNPDVDVPNVCAMCADTPCVNACPVEPDAGTGRRALFRDPESSAIRNDTQRCLGCGSCAKACAADRRGVITPNPVTGAPERMCTLCDGEPQCVKRCPFGAISYVEVQREREFYGLGPKKIATELAINWYGTADFGDVK